MRTYHMWINGQKNSTQHLLDAESAWDARKRAAAHYSNSGSRRLVEAVDVLARRVDDNPDELARLLGHLGRAWY